MKVKRHKVDPSFWLAAGIHCQSGDLGPEGWGIQEKRLDVETGSGLVSTSYKGRMLGTNLNGPRPRKPGGPEFPFSASPAESGF